MSLRLCLLCHEREATGLCNHCGPAEIICEHEEPIEARWYENNGRGTHTRPNLCTALARYGMWLGPTVHDGCGAHVAIIEHSSSKLVAAAHTAQARIKRELMRNGESERADIDRNTLELLERLVCYVKSQEARR